MKKVTFFNHLRICSIATQISFTDAVHHQRPFLCSRTSRSALELEEQFYVQLAFRGKMRYLPHMQLVYKLIQYPISHKISVFTIFKEFVIAGVQVFDFLYLGSNQNQKYCLKTRSGDVNENLKNIRKMRRDLCCSSRRDASIDVCYR